MNNPILHLKELEKEEQTKPKYKVGKKKKKKKKEETMQVGISRMCSCTILGSVIGLRRKPL